MVPSKGFGGPKCRVYAGLEAFRGRHQSVGMLGSSGDFKINCGS